MSSEKLEGIIDYLSRELKSLAKEAEMYKPNSRPRRAATAVTISNDTEVSLRTLIDNYVVVPWENYFANAVNDFPADALYDIFTHDYIDTTRFYDISYYFGSHRYNDSFFKLPREPIFKLSSYVRNLYQQSSDMVETAIANREKMDEHVRKYVATSLPFMDWML